VKLCKLAETNSPAAPGYARACMSVALFSAGAALNYEIVQRLNGRQFNLTEYAKWQAREAERLAGHGILGLLVAQARYLVDAIPPEDPAAASLRNAFKALMDSEVVLEGPTVFEPPDLSKSRERISALLARQELEDNEFLTSLLAWVDAGRPLSVAQEAALEKFEARATVSRPHNLGRAYEEDPFETD
jgi:hypothetical protein